MGFRLGLGSGGDPDGGRTARILSSCWIEEMEGVSCTNPFPKEAKVRFALDLLNQAARSCLELILRSIALYDMETVLGGVCDLV